MQISKTDPLPLSPSNNSLLTQKIGYWLGRFWSLCTFPFELIKRVTMVALTYFSRASEQQAPSSIPQPSNNPPQPSNNPLPSPKEFKKERPQAEIAEERKKSQVDEPALDLDALFYEDKEKSPAQMETDLPAPAEAQNSELKPEPASPKPDVELANEPPQYKYTRFRRRLHKRDHAPQVSLQPTQPSVNSNSPTLNPTPQPVDPPLKPSQVQTADKPVEIEPIIIEAGGAGNCQPLSILRGLEIQYPEMLKQYKESNKQDLDAKALRKMGVAFAREQIDKCGGYAAEILGYLDADRKEHNHALIDSVEQRMKREKNLLEVALKNKKISQATYEKRKKAHQERYSKQITQLEKEIIRTDADFLNHLENEGFQCSSLHLFALSIKLELPIHVHEQYGVKGHDIQFFNPTNSTKDPVHLYRVANMHYQYMLFPQNK